MAMFFIFNSGWFNKLWASLYARYDFLSPFFHVRVSIIFYWSFTMSNVFAKWNIAVGLSVLAGFMVYGFFLIYMRDFSVGKEAWVAASHTGDHFEAKLAHVHGNLFSVLNILYGYLLLKLAVPTVYAK